MLHVYAKRKPELMRVQWGSPWIHVPRDFGGLPLIYDWVNETDADEIDDNEDVCNDYESSETEFMSSDQSNDIRVKMINLMIVHLIIPMMKHQVKKKAQTMKAQTTIQHRMIQAIAMKKAILTLIQRRMIQVAAKIQIAMLI